MEKYYLDCALKAVEHSKLYWPCKESILFILKEMLPRGDCNQERAAIKLANLILE